MDTNELKKQIQNASNIIEQVDEVVTNKLVNCEHASTDFKEYQRISNDLLNVIRALDALKYDL